MQLDFDGFKALQDEPDADLSVDDIFCLEETEKQKRIEQRER